jgi:hypothetical protein
MEWAVPHDEKLYVQSPPPSRSKSFMFSLGCAAASATGPAEQPYFQFFVFDKKCNNRR